MCRPSGVTYVTFVMSWVINGQLGDDIFAAFKKNLKIFYWTNFSVVQGLEKDLEVHVHIDIGQYRAQFNKVPVF